jgi:hypothetical protein
LIDRAARKPCACLDLLASEKCRLPLDTLRHVRHLAAGSGRRQHPSTPGGICGPESEPR